MSQRPPVSADTPKALLDAFNAHDLDAIMEFFAVNLKTAKTLGLTIPQSVLQRADQLLE